MDIGGNTHSYDLIKGILPNSDMWLANISKKEFGGVKNAIFLNIEKDAVNSYSNNFDIVVALDIIEHLIDSESLIKKSHNILVDGGFLILSTPNLANFFNRLFLLFGWSFSNYHAAYTKTGNPFLKIKVANPIHGSNPHKSVFCPGQLYELLEVHGFEVIVKKGYSYVEKESDSAGTYSGLRKFFDSFLPTSMKEGIFVVAQKKS